MSSFFAKQLLKWLAANPRPLPWDDGPRDPYHIWVSEIIMQQTRIEQGAPYYLKFVNHFPSVQILADASLDEVIRYWQGLGYYSRARNLHKAAQYISKELDGAFPDTYEGLILLPGIGPYSAAAIASFAYGLSFPVVDGNVKRVIGRFSGITSSIDDAAVHDQIRSLAASYMGTAPPGTFNQAIMNFGAIVCKPKNPGCESCPLANKCFAFQYNQVATLPARTKKKSNVFRYFHFVVIRWRRKIVLQRRDAKDIWQGLYAPPIIERNSDRAPSGAQVSRFVSDIIGHENLEIKMSSPAQQQLLSHQTIIGRFHYVDLQAEPKKADNQYVWVTTKTIHDYGKPKMVTQMNDDSMLI